MLLKIQKYDVKRVNAVKLLPMTEERLEEMRASTCDDEVLKEVIQTGWPEEKQQLPAVRPYFSFRE